MPRSEPVPTPDVIPPGHSAVRHDLVLEVPAGLGASWQLVAAPVRGLHGVHAIEAGVPFSFSSKYGTRIYALPRGATLPDDVGGLAEAAVAAAGPFAEVTSTPLGTPLARVETTYRVAAIEPGNRLDLELVGERRLDAGGHELSAGPLLIALGAVAALGIAGLSLLRRRG